MLKKLFLSSLLLIGLSTFGQTVELTIEPGLTDDICLGTVTQINLEIDPTSPPSNPSGKYQIQWERFPAAPNSGNFIKNGDSDTPGIFFLRVSPEAEGSFTYRVTVQSGGTNIPREQIITVSAPPNPGLDTTIFLCGKTGTINLFNELDGGPEPGGIWSGDGTGMYNTTNQAGGSFTYTLTKGACPAQVAVLNIRPCTDDDFDKDTILNVTDIDDDNDGIPDTTEDGFCTPATRTPIFVLEEDFGFGGPTRSRYVGGTGLTFNPGIPQDDGPSKARGSLDGEYNVSNSLQIFNFNNEGAGYISTDENNHEDADGNQDGRFLAINMETASFLNKPIFLIRDLPVTPGVDYNFSMAVTNLNNEGGLLPNLRIEIIDQISGNPIAEVASGPLMDTKDVWQVRQATFNTTTTIVTVQVTNQQLTSGPGNDVGIDNIFLSSLQCDFDRDGIPNSVDLDSDNDGIYDIVENGQAALDADGDGRVDVQSNSGSITSITNSDNDGNPDFLDIDSDNDGIIDNVEAMTTANFIGPRNVDSDFNGVDDNYDTNGTPIVLANSNMNGIFDYLDLNSDLSATGGDGDCLDDTTEAYDLDQDGVADITPSGSDTDGDGLDDAFDSVVLGRLTGATNGNNNGTTPDNFPDNHTPGGDRDWREAFEEIDEIITPELDICEGANVNLFDSLPTGTAITGTWAQPTASTGTLTGGHLGTLDTTITGTTFTDGNYIYSLPKIGTCPDRKYTLPVTIIPTPFAGEDNPNVEKCTADPAFDLFGELGNRADGTTPTTGGEWTNSAGVVFGSDSKGTFTPGTDSFGIYTYTVSGGVGCLDDTATVEVKIGGANAGTAPTTPQTFCRETTATPIDLFSLLTNMPQTGGVWSDPNAATFNGTIDLSDTAFISGDYTYTVTSTGCPDATAIIAVEITEIPDLAFSGTNCSDDRSTYDVTYSLTAAATVTASVGTVDMSTFKVTGIPAGTNVTITAESTVNTSCTKDINVPAPNCECPIIPKPTNPSDESVCLSDTTVANNNIPELSVVLAAGLSGRWYLADGTTPIASAQDTDKFTPTPADLKVGENIFRVEAFNTTEMCPSTQIEVKLFVIQNPVIVAPTKTENCEEFTLEPLTIGNYFTGPDGTGTQINAGEVLTASENLFIYAETVMNGITCSSEVPFNVTVIPLPTLVLPPNGTVCADMRDTTYDVTYVLTGTATITASVGTVDLINSKITGIPATQNVTITAESPTASNCRTVELLVTAPNCSCPTIDPPTMPSDLSMCSNDTTVKELSVVLAAGQSGRWYLADGTPIASAQNTDRFTPNATDLEPGENIFKVEAFDTTEMCPSSQVDVKLTVNTTPLAGTNGSIDNLCEGDPDISDINLFDFIGGEPSRTGSWTDPNGAPFGSGFSVNLNPDTVISGSYTYTVTSFSGCSPNTAQVTVEVLPIPAPRAPILEDAYCKEFPLPTLAANQRYSSTSLSERARGNGFDLFPNQMITETTDLFLIEENANNCEGEIAFRVAIETIAQVNFEELGAICVDDNGNLTNPFDTRIIESNLSAADYTFKWELDGTELTAETGPSLEASRAGRYTLTFTSTSPLLCNDSAETTIIANQAPKKENFVITTNNNTIEIQNNSTAEGVEYQLDGGITQTSNVFTNVPFGQYEVFISNSCGGFFEPVTLFGFPSFFSPNDDASNDIWNVEGYTDPDELVITIYDRYGKLLSRFTPLNPGWNGTFNDVNMPADDYWYYAKTTSGKEYRGHFSLLR